MPVYPEEKFVEAVEQVVRANAAWVPPYGSGATLYLRPYMFGTNAVIGVNLPMNISSVCLPRPWGLTLRAASSL